MFKIAPRPYQLNELMLHGEAPLRALWWEQGTGKTKVAIDSVASLHRKGQVTGLLIVAPRGVEANWTVDEIPDHMPDDVPLRTMCWSTQRRHTRAHREQFEQLLETPGGTLAVLAISYSAIMTDDGAKAVRKFLDTFRCFYVVDEATAIKTPGTKVTKRVLASAKYAQHRRLLNGTPVTDSPFHAYTQVKFVDPNAWARIGISNFESFKVFFGEWEKGHRKDGREYPKFIRHRNLDILNRIVMEVGTRVLKSEVLPELPPKIYTKRHFELSAEQRRVYGQLRDDFFTWLASGEEITAELAIVRLMRLQQVCSNYVVTDEDRKDRQRISAVNPRIECLHEVLEEVAGEQAIIWAKYSADIDEIAAALTAAGKTFVTYDGRTSEEDRLEAKQGFQEGRYQYFVAKPSAAGRGLTLTAASVVVYYNNDFVLDNRLQSEDRAHRLGQHRPVRYIDIVAQGTVDEHILAVLRRKRDISSVVTGDQLTAWI